MASFRNRVKIMHSVVPLILKSKQFGDVIITKDGMKQCIQNKLINEKDDFDHGSIDAIENVNVKWHVALDLLRCRVRFICSYQKSAHTAKFIK